MSQQQQEHMEQVEQVQREVVPASDVSVAADQVADQREVVEKQGVIEALVQTDTAGKKGKQRKWKWVDVKSVSPRPSYWPLGLAVSLCLLLIGVVIHPIVMGIGLVLVLTCVIGWSLERR